MMQSTALDELVRTLDLRERLRRVNESVFFTPLAEAAIQASSPAATINYNNSQLDTEGAFSSGHVSTPRYAQLERRYLKAGNDYGLEGKFYVHVPHWVKLRSVPAHQTGPNLFGFAYPATGHAYVRDDLFDDHEQGELRQSEVRLHEVLHVLYPTAPEEQIRMHVRSILGSRAVIHSRLG
jgi:hypothetical protein